MLHSSQGLMPCGREDRRSDVSGARLRSFRHSCSDRPPSLPATLGLCLCLCLSVSLSVSVSVSVCLSLSLSLSLSVCLSVCLSLSISRRTFLHMRVARQTPPSRQKQCTLRSANSRGGSAACRSAALDPSAREYVSACADSSTRSSWVLHLPTACGLHCPFAAAVATKSRSNLVPSPPSLPSISKTNDRTAVPQRFVFSASPTTAATPGFDALSL